MHSRHVLGVALATFVMLAGCSGQFDVVQTEPLQIEVDGDGDNARVSESDAEPHRTSVETRDLESVEIEVEVASASSGPVTVLVEVQGPENETLATKEITVQAPDQADTATVQTTAANTTTAYTTNTTTANSTTSATTTASANETGNATSAPPADNGTSGSGMDSSTTIETLVIDVHGKDNIVVVTQAMSGDADVTIAAHDASGGSSVDGNATGENATYP